MAANGSGISRVSGIFRSDDLGANWVKMGFAGDADGTLNPGSQGIKNFALVADPVNPNVVYASGDRQAGSPSTGAPNEPPTNAASRARERDLIRSRASPQSKADCDGQASSPRATPPDTGGRQAAASVPSWPER